MTKRTCEQPDCDSPYLARGLCAKHYRRLTRYGGVEVPERPPAPAKGCAVEGCDRAHNCRGFCELHYTRLRKHGDPVAVLPRPGSRHLNSVLALLPAEDCVPWPGALNMHGYGSCSKGTRAEGITTAHRRVYEAVVGPIPTAMELDHLCHTRDTNCHLADRCPHRACVNPAHLEPVSVTVNHARSRRWPSHGNTSDSRRRESGQPR